MPEINKINSLEGLAELLGEEPPGMLVRGDYKESPDPGSPGFHGKAASEICDDLKQPDPAIQQWPGDPK